MNPPNFVLTAENAFARNMAGIIQDIIEGDSPNPGTSPQGCWMEWRRQLQASQPSIDEAYEHFVVCRCYSRAVNLPKDELELLITGIENCSYKPFPGEDRFMLVFVVTQELYRRVKMEAGKQIVSLYLFIIKLVDDWNKDREEDPEGIPTAAEVTRTIWNADETNLAYSVKRNANSLTIADVLKDAGIEYFGGLYWEEMENYINCLPENDRERMCLREFTEIFYDVLRGYG